MRRVWIPPAAVTAAAMILSHGLGRWPWTLLFLPGFAAYWAGLDAAARAWPLARGRPVGKILDEMTDRQRESSHSRITFRVAPDTGTSDRPSASTQRNAAFDATVPRTSAHR